MSEQDEGTRAMTNELSPAATTPLPLPPFPFAALALFALGAGRIVMAFLRAGTDTVDVAFATVVTLLAVQALWSYAKVRRRAHVAGRRKRSVSANDPRTQPLSPTQDPRPAAE